jgi:hypothetical protein
VRLVAILMCVLSIASAQPAADPVLAGAREMALAYSRTLPDFLCTEFIRRFGNWVGTDVRIDTLTLQIGYSQLRETYRLVARDNHASHQSLESLNGAISRGEFGSALRFIFDPVSAAEFEAQPPERIRRRPVAVYTYSVPLERSHYKLAYGTEETMTAYHGRVYIETSSSRVLRLTMEVDPPAGFPIRETRSTIDYDLRDVGGAPYLLPVRAEVRTLEAVGKSKMRYRNVEEFRDYRKFSTESKLSFEK